METSTFEQERKNAIATLVKLGVAKYVKDTELYHGRAGDGSQWEVDPTFNNAKNNTGNHNVYSVSGLYAGDFSTAKNFAIKRANSSYGKIAEVHKIVSNDPDAILVNLNFNESQLSPLDQQLYYSALQTLCSFSLTQDNPIKYEHKDAYPIIIEECRKIQKKYNIETLSESCINEIFWSVREDKTIKNSFKSDNEIVSFINDLISAYNTKSTLKSYPLFILNQYINGKNSFQYSNSDQTYPINSSFISAWCANNHIVGISQLVESATLSQTITSNVLFDMKKIMSERQHGEMLQETLTNFGDLTASLINIVDTDMQKFLTTANSKEIIDFINKSPMCRALYNESAYIWEGWSVGQHTESVIDFFDRYFSEEVPEELRPFIKVVILAHDIGKGQTKGDKSLQNKYNLANTHHLYNALNIPSNYRHLIDFIITESQNITTSIILNRGDKNLLKDQLRYRCAQTFRESFNRLPNDQELSGLMKICTTLQSCDSGAYTRYAQIRDGQKMVGGANDNFTQSFVLNERGQPRLKIFEDEGM